MYATMPRNLFLFVKPPTQALQLSITSESSCERADAQESIPGGSSLWISRSWKNRSGEKVLRTLSPRKANKEGFKLRNKSIEKKMVVYFLKVGVVVFGFVLPLWLLACIVYPKCIIPWYLSTVLVILSVAAASFCVKRMNRIEREEKRNHKMCRRYASSDRPKDTRACWKSSLQDVNRNGCG